MNYLRIWGIPLFVSSFAMSFAQSVVELPRVSKSSEVHPLRVIVKFRETVNPSTDSDPWLQRYSVRSLRTLSLKYQQSNAGNDWENEIRLIQGDFPERAMRAYQDVIPDLSRTYVLDLETNSDPIQIAAQLQADPRVDYAQPDYVMELYQLTTPSTPRLSTSVRKRIEASPRTPTLFPNDPYFHSSNSWGQGYDDLWGLKKIHALQAWQQFDSQGEGVVVAVVDSGLDYNHPDIAANLWWNAGERPQANGIDDDGNGLIDDRRGWDFTTCTFFDGSSCAQPKTPDNDPMDQHGHGTHVSGTIAAVGNNGLGVIGVAPKARIMPLKALNDQGLGYSSELAEAIRYAASEGADVINCSFGCNGDCPSNPVLEEAVQFAHGLGCVVVFAAGNSNADVVAVSPQNSRWTITVASSDHEDQRSSFSNYGIDVDLAAPGGDSGSGCEDRTRQNILSLRATGTDLYANSSCVPSLAGQLIVGGNYYRARGTSMAAPHVSGAAALVLSKHPEFSNEDVRQALRVSADDIEANGFDLLTGTGRLDSAAALAQDSVLRVQINFPSSGSNWSDLNGALSVEGVAAGVGFQNFKLFTSPVSASPQWSLIEGSPLGPVEGGRLGTWSLSDLNTGSYWLKLEAQDQNGQIYSDAKQIYLERGLRRLTTDPSWQWSPDIWGNRVVYVDSRDFGVFNTGIYLYDLSTGEERAITHSNSYSPSIWGSWIVWQDKRNGNWDIYAFNLLTNTERQITSSSANQMLPQIWENRVVWQDERHGNFDIYFYDLNTSVERRITTSLAIQEKPKIWGNRIVWTDYRNGDADIYQYRISQLEESPLFVGPRTQEPADLWGNRVLWVEDLLNEAHTWGIYAIDLSNNQQWTVNLNQSNGASLPRLFGDSVVWSSSSVPGQDEDLYFADLLTGHQQILSSQWAAQSEPAIYGDQIVWSDFRDGNFEIYSRQTPGLRAAISNPMNGETVEIFESPLLIIGTASGAGFSSYRFEYSSSDSTQWTVIGQSFSTPVVNDLLLEWEASELCPGQNYRLRLVVESAFGDQAMDELEFSINRSFQISESIGLGQTRYAISGSRVVWREMSNNFALIFARDFQAGELRLIEQTQGLANSPDISMDRVVWAYAGSIWAYNWEQNQSVRIYIPGFAASNPKVSGDRAIWTKNVNIGGGIFVSQVALYSFLNQSEGLIAPSTSPQTSAEISGNHVVWLQEGHLFLYDIANGTGQWIVGPPFDPRAPMDIDGDFVVWMDQSVNQGEIYLYRISTGQIQRLTNDNIGQRNPRISQGKVVCEEFQGGNWDVVLYDIESGERISVVDGPGAQVKPMLSWPNLLWSEEIAAIQRLVFEQIDCE